MANMRHAVAVIEEPNECTRYISLPLYLYDGGGAGTDDINTKEVIARRMARAKTNDGLVLEILWMEV